MIVTEQDREQLVGMLDQSIERFMLYSEAMAQIINNRPWLSDPKIRAAIEKTGQTENFDDFNQSITLEIVKKAIRREGVILTRIETWLGTYADAGETIADVLVEQAMAGAQLDMMTVRQSIDAPKHEPEILKALSKRAKGGGRLN